MILADRESMRRSINNKRYREKKKVLANETIAQYRTWLASESSSKIGVPISILYKQLLYNEIQQILKFDVNLCISESLKKFLWVIPCSSEDKYILQFMVSDGLFIDLLYVVKSKILNVGYGLFCCLCISKRIGVFYLYRPSCYEQKYQS